MRNRLFLGLLAGAALTIGLTACGSDDDDKTETGSRVRGRIEAILDWARVAGLRDGPNPAAWKGHLAHMLPRRSQVRAVEQRPPAAFAHPVVRPGQAPQAA